MQPRPAVVALPSLSDIGRAICWPALLLALLVGAGPSRAQEQGAAEGGFLAAIELHTEAELDGVLRRAEQLLVDGALSQDPEARVTFVLHGPEVRVLLRRNYLAHKDVVDLAARLSALGVVDIKVCRTWMGGNSVEPAELQPFVETVPYGLTEIRRLVEEESYVYF